MAKTRNPNGMGTIRKIAEDRYEWRQMVDRELRTCSAKSLTELQEKIKGIIGLPITKNKIKVTEWFEKWLKNDIEPLKKQATYDQYKSIWEQHIKPKIGNKLIKKISRIDIQEVITEMNKKVIQEEVKGKDGNIIKPKKIGLSTCTMKHAKKIMNLAFEKALDDKIIPQNPVSKIEIPKKQAKTRKTLTAEELGKIFRQIKDCRWYWCFKFMLVTGLRRGEVLALKHSNIDYKNKKIVVEESSGGDTKSSVVHYVPLSDKAILYLDGQKQMLIKEVNPILHNKELEKTNLIFPNKSGKMLSGKSLTQSIALASERAGIHVSPHMFRHTFVYMNKGLLSLAELQEALGHDESTSTLDIYGTMLSDTEKVAHKIDDAFKEIDEEIKKIENKEIAKVIQMNTFKKVK